MKTFLALIIILLPITGLSSEKMKCEIFKSGEKGQINIIAKCENDKKVCYVSDNGGIDCKLKQ